MCENRWDYTGIKQIKLVTTNRTILNGLTRVGKVSNIEDEVAHLLRELEMPVTIVLADQQNILMNRAKEEAKQAASRTELQVAYRRYTKSAAKKAAKAETDERMQIRLETESDNDILKEFAPEWKSIPKHLTSNYFVTQVISRHGAFGYYLDRFDVKDEHGNFFSPMCWCDGSTVQTVRHVLLDCPLFEDIRGPGYAGASGELVGPFTNLNQWIRHPYQMERSMVQMKLIVQRLIDYRLHPQHIPAEFHRELPTRTAGISHHRTQLTTQSSVNNSPPPSQDLLLTP